MLRKTTLKFQRNKSLDDLKFYVFLCHLVTSMIYGYSIRFVIGRKGKQIRLTDVVMYVCVQMYNLVCIDGHT